MGMSRLGKLKLKSLDLRRAVVLLLALVTALAMLVVPASADEEDETEDPVSASTAYSAPDMSKACTLKIKTSQSGTFTVWKVADAAYNGSGMLYLTLTDEVAATGVSVDMTRLGTSYSETAASTLSNMLNGQSSITPVVSEHIEANENGVSLGTFPVGLYLVDCVADPDGDVEMSPVLVALPSIVNHQWVYDVTIDAVKFSFDVKMTHFRVVKVWDDGNYKKRPVSATIQITNRLSGESETVTLDSSNNWSYEWDTEEEMVSSDWAITEVNVDPRYNFTVEYVRDNGFGVFTVTNKPKGVLGESETETPPTTPTTSVPGGKSPVKTGDDSPIGMLIGIMAVSAVAIAVVLSSRRKKEE